MSSLDSWKAQVSDEQKPALKEGRLNLESFSVVQLRQNRRSAQLLAVIDELDRLIAAETTGTASWRTLGRARRSAAQELAKHLDANPSPSRQVCFAMDDGRYVWIVLEVEGPPSRPGRKQAEEWMASRGQPWTGNIKKLHAAMRRALRNGEKLPAGHFGLRVERTVRIVSDSIEGFRAELPNSLQS